MSDVIRSSKADKREQRRGAAPRARVTRGGWTPRGAIIFWIAASGLVWIALAASAIWVY